jgi:hypothetical protein
MRRTRSFWRRLRWDERSTLALMERSPKYGGRSPYIPDDCSECAFCGCPGIGRFCDACAEHYDYLIHKAEGANAPTVGRPTKETSKAAPPKAEHPQ